MFTVGHGARSAAELVSTLVEAHVHIVVDVRAFPVSRRHPQFSRDALQAVLAREGIAYEWQGKALGGYRRIPYVQHMSTPDFAEAAGRLAGRAEHVCIMCAESNPAQCHRAHISDWLVQRGHRVMHLLGPGRSVEHVLNPQEELWRDA